MTLVVAQENGTFLFNWEEIVEQSEVWIDRGGDYHRIEEMSPIYRANALRWLTHAIGPQLLQEMIERHMSGSRPQGEMAQDAFDNEFDELLGMTSEAFILQTPLGEALSS